MVGDGAFSHKKECVPICEEILNLEGHPNHISGSEVKAILLKISPIGRASAVEGLRSTGLPSLVFMAHLQKKTGQTAKE